MMGLAFLLWSPVELWATRRYIKVIFHIQPEIGPFAYIWSEQCSKICFLGGNGHFGGFESKKIKNFRKFLIFSFFSVEFSSQNHARFALKPPKMSISDEKTNFRALFRPNVSKRFYFWLNVKNSLTDSPNLHYTYKLKI